MMTNEVIYEKVTSTLRSVLENDTIAVTPEMTAHDADEWDSFAHIRIILTIEQEFGIKFATPELAQFENIQQLVDMIAVKVGAK